MESPPRPRVVELDQPTNIHDQVSLRRDAVYDNASDVSRTHPSARSSAEIQVYDRYATKQMLSSDTTLSIPEPRSNANIPFSRYFQLAKPLRTVSAATNALRLNVDIIFLPGSDLPEVIRSEQAEMIGRSLYQKGTQWRVNTAEAILTYKYIACDLGVSPDVTAIVTSIVQKRLGSTHTPGDNDVLEIHSGHVEIVYSFRPVNLGLQIDLSATLIEVNAGSLWDVVADFEAIIVGSRPNVSPQQRQRALHGMIDNAQLFYLKSPVLSRVVTRKKIVESQDTRYGIDDGSVFKTFVTSKGIQEIIMRSSSYYLSFDLSGLGPVTTSQNATRSRYLQMMVMLLSLLNHNDLGQIGSFLQDTYGLAPSQLDLELLFLKVMPLTSVNATAFVEALIHSVHQVRPPETGGHFDAETEWTEFIKYVAKRGYMLPAKIEKLGVPDHSWVTKWSAEGKCSSTVFSRLQYHGDKPSTFNDIPAVRLTSGSKPAVVTVTMFNEKWTISREAYRLISAMRPGSYIALRYANKQPCDVRISETHVNCHILKALETLHDAVQESTGRTRNTPQRLIEGSTIMQDGTPTGRLTRHDAVLNDELLASAYKLDGHARSKDEAVVYMAESNNRVKAILNSMPDDCRSSVEQIGRDLAHDTAAMKNEMHRPPIRADPISKAVSAEQTDGSSQKIWHEYWVDVIDDPKHGKGLLQVKAKVDFVASVTWKRDGSQANVSLANTGTRLLVAPLEPCSAEQQAEEIEKGDRVLLMGRYMVIASPDPEQKGKADDDALPRVMTNWLEITESITEATHSRRRRNGAQELPVTLFI